MSARTQCGKPAVDFVEIDDAGAHLAMFAVDGAMRTRIWMCVDHFDNWMSEKNDTIITHSFQPSRFS